MSKMRDKRLYLLIPIAVLLLITGINYAETLKVGDKVPEVVAEGLEGNAKTLSDFKDKIIIIDFWATWCRPCIKEFPDFEKFYKKYKDKGIELIAISVDNDLKKVQKFAKSGGTTFTILKDIDHKTAKNFKIDIIPVLFIIGSDGFIKYEPIVGGKPDIDKFLEEKIKELFNK